MRPIEKNSYREFLVTLAVNRWFTEVRAIRPIEEKMARQRAVMLEAEQWLREHGSRLENACIPHRMAVVDRFVQWSKWRRDKQLLKYGRLIRRTFRRVRRPI